jgi:hypothetical protein
MGDGDSFQEHLRTEVVMAEQRFATLRNSVFSLLDAPGGVLGPVLLAAADELAEATRLYIGALRRLAYFTANEAEKAAAKSSLRQA